MTGWEILLAFANNSLWMFKTLAIASVIVTGILVIIIAVTFEEDTSDDQRIRTGALRGIRLTIPAVILFGLLASLPDVEDLWKIRLGLLKLELVSPANVQKLTETGGEHIDLIVKGLECKYLNQNCPKKEEEKK